MFESHDPEQRKEDDLKHIIELLEQLLELLQEKL